MKPYFIIIYTWTTKSDPLFYFRLKTLAKWYPITKPSYTTIRTRDIKAFKELIALCKRFEKRGLKWEAYLSYKVKT